KSGDKTGPAVKTIKLLAQSTGEFTRDELKKDARLSWTDKARAEIAAAKGGAQASPNPSEGGGNGDNPGTGGDSGGGDDGGGDGPIGDAE
ncbi:MAG: hypothetical protein IK144_13160, partial [Bacteroidaceae bacterium]|nr:hypothetical protein [Bacteroidaceae bacterium]